MIDSLYDKFKTWSADGGIWLIGDLHLGDSDCRYMDKEWPEPKKQISLLKKACNGKNNTLIVLGDVGSRFYLLDQLTCYKVLIKGNHDKGNSNYLGLFNEIYSGPLFISDKILLSHEPISCQYAVNIHGHEHNGQKYNLDGKYKHVNLAANVCGYIPVSLKYLIKKKCILSKVKNIHKSD